MRDQRIVIHGAGTAGIGIADVLRGAMIGDGLSPQEATARIYALFSHGLLVTGNPQLRDFQLPYARPAAEVESWADSGVPITLAEIVTRVRPTILIGTSAQTGAFTPDIVQDMAAHTRRPIIMPLSNPTSRCEALPEDLIRWTNGWALVATGSPFLPVTHHGRTYQIAQANNALIFPGLGLGVTITRASRITEPILTAAAEALAKLSDPTPGAPLLPPIDNLRAVSAAVAIAVAVTTTSYGLAQRPVSDPVQQVHRAMWRPEYPRIEIDLDPPITR